MVMNSKNLSFAKKKDKKFWSDLAEQKRNQKFWNEADKYQKKNATIIEYKNPRRLPIKKTTKKEAEKIIKKAKETKGRTRAYEIIDS